MFLDNEPVLSRRDFLVRGCQGFPIQHVTEKLRLADDLAELVVLAQLDYKIQMTKLFFSTCYYTSQHIRAFKPFTLG